MNTFDFYQDRKVTCWERTQFSIEAESYKEALEIIKSWRMYCNRKVYSCKLGM